MARTSGIGRYIREVVPRVFSGRPDWTATLLGDDREAGLLARAAGSTTLHRRFTAPIYSVREQADFPRAIPADAELLWCPHYNVPLLSRMPLMVTVHDVIHVARPEFVNGSHRRFVARILFRAVAARASRIICVSEFSAREFAEHVRVDRARVRVVRQGVGAEWFDMPPPPSHPRPYFVFVGNVKPHKNLRGLITAFEALVDRLPHDLVIVGRKDGFISGDLEVQKGAGRLGDRCHFTGELGDDEVRGYVAHAEALVLPSHYEGFGLPALEAMASGCPAIVSRSSSLPEVCGDAALYFDPTDPAEIAREMRRVVENRVLRQELAEAGRERARMFRWEDSARLTAEVLSEALDVGPVHSSRRI